MNDYIVVIKLINGQDIVAVIVDETDSIIEVEYPFNVVYSQAVGGALMTPYSLYTDEHNFRFRADSIISISKATPKVADYYLELTQQYNEYLNKTYTIDNLNTLLDELDNLTNPDLDLESSSNPIVISGNDTKH